MTNFYRKTLIISPHSDDEIFTFPFIFSPDNSFGKIDLLLLETDDKRLQESRSSCERNGFNLLTLPTHFKLKGLHFFENIDHLTENLLTIYGQYDLILAPMIEGGHQDHDSVCLAILHCKDNCFSETKLILYSTYRSQNLMPLLYTCGISKKVPSELVFSVSMPPDWLSIYALTIIKSYRSQYLTWFMLTPLIMISLLRGNLNKFIFGNKLNCKDAIALIPNKPLYQTYRKCSRKKWLDAHKFIIKS
tara:strand:+ start:327 stop:1067 length:741 start_codon:yes stop_codon:yes gene_type:complete